MAAMCMCTCTYLASLEAMAYHADSHGASDRRDGSCMRADHWEVR